MPTTTPNFGWSVPVSTDLVKDGATAIELLGDSIDTSLVDLLGGTTGQVLTKASNTDLDFSFTTPAAGGGKVLQVVMGSTSTTTSNSTTTFADTTLTATITPSSASSKVLVLGSQNGCTAANGNSGNALEARLVRGSTGIATFAGDSMWTNSDLLKFSFAFGINYLDTPATTAATTYKTQFKNEVAAAYVQVQSGDTTSTIILIEIGA